MNPFRLIVLPLAFTFGASIPPASAQQHEHHHAAPATAAQTAPAQKWQPDAPLRKGMAAIRKVEQDAMARAHKGTLKKAEFDAVANAIDSEIKTIFSTCKLAPEADAALHGVLLPMMDGVKLLRGAGSDRHKGLMKIDAALVQYGLLFDHPGWR